MRKLSQLNLSFPRTVLNVASSSRLQSKNICSPFKYQNTVYSVLICGVLKNKQKNLKDYLCEAKKYWLFEKKIKHCKSI